MELRGRVLGRRREEARIHRTRAREGPGCVGDLLRLELGQSRLGLPADSREELGRVNAGLGEGPHNVGELLRLELVQPLRGHPRDLVHRRVRLPEADPREAIRHAGKVARQQPRHDGVGLLQQLQQRVLVAPEEGAPLGSAHRPKRLAHPVPRRAQVHVVKLARPLPVHAHNVCSGRRVEVQLAVDRTARAQPPPLRQPTGLGAPSERRAEPRCGRG
mmetsp:Transcript_13124/g.33347  ORF Transcript_13124/g.33347 Transcript_13124/m.33347 type:complete len:217 (+) Transcript_13124:370-1020(+)